MSRTKQRVLPTTLTFKRLTSKTELSLELDGIIEGLKTLSRKTKVRVPVDHYLQMFNWNIESPDTYFLTAHDEFLLQGFMYAVVVPCSIPWVEVPCVWSLPGVATLFRDEGWKLLKEWSLSRGADTVVAVITRSPKSFFNFFHRPLGFEKVGLLVEAKLNGSNES